MKHFENELYANGIKYVAGTDEVGRGPLAGPVVAAAVIFDKDYQNDLINDSKKLTKKQRDMLFEQIKQDAIAFEITFIDVETIDKINIKAASRLAMKTSIENLGTKPEHVLVDFETLDILLPQTGIVKGDEKSISIAAASILAKVARDRYMDEIHKEFPIYDWDKNAGYGSAKHRKAIEEFGWTIHHRTTFNPVKTLIKNKKA